jgi:uncharacterized protein (DUF1697 family)
MTHAATFLGLLRGINVGGRSVLRMAELKGLLASLGYEDVETYIQSGNVLFGSPTDDAVEIAADIEQAIARAFDVSPALLLRTPSELEDVVGGNPFVARGLPESALHVAFLDREPVPERPALLDPGRSPPDELALQGRELYLHLPNGAGRSKLTLDYVERTLDVRATQRNWRTVLALLALSRARE